jgi:hypothetical protein
MFLKLYLIEKSRWCRCAQCRPGNGRLGNCRRKNWYGLVLDELSKNCDNVANKNKYISLIASLIIFSLMDQG